MFLNIILKQIIQTYSFLILKVLFLKIIRQNYFENIKKKNQTNSKAPCYKIYFFFGLELSISEASLDSY